MVIALKLNTELIYVPTERTASVHMRQNAGSFVDFAKQPFQPVATWMPLWCSVCVRLALSLSFLLCHSLPPTLPVVLALNAACFCGRTGLGLLWYVWQQRHCLLHFLRAGRSEPALLWCDLTGLFLLFFTCVLCGLCSLRPPCSTQRLVKAAAASLTLLCLLSEWVDFMANRTTHRSFIYPSIKRRSFQMPMS